MPLPPVDRVDTAAPAAPAPTVCHLLGFGNPLHGDDGVGPAVVAALQAGPLPAGLRVFDVGTRGLDALPLLQGCDEAWLVDAAQPAGEPGRVQRHPLASLMAAQAPALHDAGLAYLVRAAASLGPLPRLHILTVEAAALQPFRPGLSPAVVAAVARLLPALRAGRLPDQVASTQLATQPIIQLSDLAQAGVRGPA